MIGGWPLFSLTSEGKEIRYKDTHKKEVLSDTKIDISEFWAKFGKTIAFVLDNNSTKQIRIQYMISCQPIYSFIVQDKAGRTRKFEIYGSPFDGAVLENSTQTLPNEYVELYKYMTEQQ